MKKTKYNYKFRSERYDHHELSGMKDLRRWVRRGEEVLEKENPTGDNSLPISEQVPWDYFEDLLVLRGLERQILLHFIHKFRILATRAVVEGWTETQLLEAMVRLDTAMGAHLQDSDDEPSYPVEMVFKD